ncbi:Nuclear receptor coactivator 7 [Clonorchis sinensis]|uniref:Oxidation resistance protein 1 n=1 Tax=Clonorchis sinensis TaxID=79923 RepID=A0A8T1MYC7_CLOSI|nr:Nuclear receptor coactivator 7 [Clonorchis sinensis]
MESHSDDTILYEVKPGDSLSAIAAQFGYVTPTQLARINRLSLIGCGLPPVFPGQKLLVPTLNRGSLDPLKIRRAPGTALRVRASTTIQTIQHSSECEFNINPNFYSQTRRTISDSSRIDEENERQFVKVPVQRLLPDGKLVDGVLLITPDALCFDAAQLALAQKRAYLAQHPSLSSTDNSPRHRGATGDSSTATVTTTPSRPSTPEITTTIPKELMDLGLCIPLSAISSMTTLKKFVQRRSSNQHDQTPSHIHQHHSSVDVSESNKSDSTQDDRHETGVPRDLGDHSEVDNGVAGDVFDAPSELPPHQVMTESVEHRTTNGTDHLVDSSPSSRSFSASANGSHTEDIKDNDFIILEAENSLFLRLMLVHEAKQIPLEHTFKIPTDRIAEVFAFLLRAGVGANHNKRLTSSSSSHLVDDEHNKSLSRRSMVEEALECMESATPLPGMYNGTSAILSDDMLEDLGANFPTHWIGSNLRLVYKTEQDGYSLHTLYRKAREVTGGVLLLIRDTSGMVFGALMSETMHCSQHFYGTGETCVFHWSPDFKRYDWTKKNYFFMRGSPASFQIGGQSGRNAIWFDEALKYGRSEPTDTFDNPILSGRLAEFQFASLSNPDNTSTDQENDNPRDDPDTNVVSPNHSVASADVDSIPFLIDCLELWELVS